MGESAVRPRPASNGMNVAGELIGRLVKYIINPAILLIFTAGFLLFLWGLVVFIFKLEEGGDHKEGKNHMLYGLIGMLVMVSVGGIIAILSNTFDLRVDPKSGTYNPDLSRMDNVLPAANFFGSVR